MKKDIWLSVCALLALFIPNSALAAALCCQISSSVQERFSGSAMPNEGELSVQLGYSFTRMDEFREGDTERSLDYVKANSGYTSLPVGMDMVKYTFTAGYGISEDSKIFISVPYIRNTMDMTMYMMGMWQDHTMEPVSGLGDISIMWVKRIYADSLPRPSSTLSVGIGIKTPSGSFTETNASGTKFIHAHMQPGTGSWDPLASLIYARAFGGLELQIDAAYQLTTENRNGYEFGDSSTVSVSGKYDVGAGTGLLAGITYLHVGKARDKEGRYTTLTSLMDDPKNTGSDSLWFSPGIQFAPREDTSLSLKFQTPVWIDANGIQLVTRYQFVAAMSYRF